MAGLKKILLVDDEEDLREALAEQLAATEDFEVVEAGRSEERRAGKECRSRWPPDH